MTITMEQFGLKTVSFIALTIIVSGVVAEYISPRLKPDNIFLYENFDDEQQFTSKWIQSSDPKYEGKWELSSGNQDRQLILPLKARHYAISSRLVKPFKFTSEPLIVQYEVQFREGLDCGGAYIKLLRQQDDLLKLTDKTPFTIMFGPDKCGSESKLHFIIQYLNPKTQELEEKHWKQGKLVTSLMSIFSDKSHHLFRFVLKPNNDFEIFLDDKSVGKGNLLEDLDPPVNPPKEIVDPNDSKPMDWDERPQIEDADAKKPDDWDEDAPKTIEDPNAKKPEDWLEDEPKYVADPEATKPKDWEEMDGEWEAPLIENPACAKVSGCGPWKAPTIPNPSFKGIWKRPRIDNPAYKGKWSPRMISNPDYFFDENPFSSLEPIGALTFELWSMADNISFDNIIVADKLEPVDLLQTLTWQDKKSEADASSPSLLTRAQHYLKTYPWLWVVLALLVALPLFLFISYCCDTKRNQAARRKRTDDSRPDDESKLEEEPQESEEVEDGDEEEEEDEEEDQDVEVADEQESNEEEQAGDRASKRPVRQRRKN